MYILAGEIVSEVSGSTWADFVTERFFQRLKMTSTFALGVQVRTENRATSHGLVDGKVVAIKSEDRDEVIAPAGSIRSCAKDMAQWLLVCLGEGEKGNHLLRPEILWEMQSLQMSIPVTARRGGTCTPHAFTVRGLDGPCLTTEVESSATMQDRREQ
jgi:CubicO group peptidase (beta-lactamase class C family)